jgi:hypothetical protein
MARYPPEVDPNDVERFTLAGSRLLEVAKARVEFRPWTGGPLDDDYGGKQVLDLGGAPGFAELAVLRMFERAGWTGVWIDTYRHAYRRAYWGVPPVVELPAGPTDLLRRIEEANGSRRAGAWDVFCWRDGAHMFVESKRSGHDRMRSTQIAWLDSALRIGLSPEDFLVVEWTLASGRG